MTDKKWSATHSAEGYPVIKHDDYGLIPAWTDDIASVLVALLEDGPSADFQFLFDAVLRINMSDPLPVKEN